MTQQISYPEDSSFFKICQILFEIANMEHHKRIGKFLYNADKIECTVFEYRFLKIYEDVRGILNASFGLNIALSLIAQFPSDDYMRQYRYTAKGYALYHYSVICHKLSTIRDIYRKIVNHVCEFNIDTYRNDNVSWKKLEAQLKKDPKYSQILQCLNSFQKQFDRYIEDRQRSSHEGVVYNNIFDAFYITELYSSIEQKNGNKLRQEYKIGTKENQVLMNQSKQEYVEFLTKIIRDVSENIDDMFKVLEPIILTNLHQILSKNIECWNSVSKKKYDSILDLLDEINKTQVHEYWEVRKVI